MAKKGELQGEYVPCANCGKMLYRNPYRLKTRKNHYCDNKCQAAHQNKDKFEYRKCEICGKEFYCSKKSTKRFCCHKCQNEWQKTRVGINNPRFEGVLVECEFCGKEFYARKYKLKNGQHLFCCNNCRTEWYKQVYSQQECVRIASRERAIRMLNNNEFPTTQTKPQLKINNLLDEIGVKYENEFSCEYYSIDNYLVDSNLMIEVNGDFWHCSPLKYDSINTQEIHAKRVKQDHIKEYYIKNQYGINILYLWENDINNNIELCKKLISMYINNNGVLQNYHSFNYSILNDELILNDEIIVPFQDRCS